MNDRYVGVADGTDGDVDGKDRWHSVGTASIDHYSDGDGNGDNGEEEEHDDEEEWWPPRCPCSGH